MYSAALGLNVVDSVRLMQKRRLVCVETFAPSRKSVSSSEHQLATYQPQVLLRICNVSESFTKIWTQYLHTYTLLARYWIVVHVYVSRPSRMYQSLPNLNTSLFKLHTCVDLCVASPTHLCRMVALSCRWRFLSVCHLLLCSYRTASFSKAHIGTQMNKALQDDPFQLGHIDNSICRWTVNYLSPSLSIYIYRYI